MVHIIKNRKLSFYLAILMAFIVFLNFKGVKEILGLNKGYYGYSNFGGSVTLRENFRHGKYMSNEYPSNFWKSPHFKRAYPSGNVDTVLYRNFAINPLKFWRWGEYMFNWRYRLPYISWKEVRKRRGYDLEYSDNFRDF